MNLKLSEILFRLENPQVYTGQEINVIKNSLRGDPLNICLIFPDTYEIGMSHFGLKILYHFLNRYPNVNAERCFLPTEASIRVFEEMEVPLFSIENKMPLKKFDLLSFSLLSEMNYTNILQVLDLAGIPLKSSERTLKDPLIAAGGISSCNPEPLRDYIDFFGFGDGEVLFPDIIKVFQKAKTQNLPGESILRELDSKEGFYVPSFYPVKKQGGFWIPDMGSKQIKKRILETIDRTFPDEDIIVPVSKVIFNRLDVEIARGCPQSCRFCQAKSYYAPFRTKSIEKNIDFIRKALKKTGFETFSLSSLSSGDYPGLESLLQRIPENIPQCTAVSVSSLRPSSLSHQLLSTISMFRKTGITIVPEAATTRLRQSINKQVTDEQVFGAIEEALKNNWKQLKLYFMIGLPGETEDDVRAIITLIENILKYTRERGKKIKIHASISNFVPKPHTPFQWAERELPESLSHKIDILKNGLKKYRNVQFDFHSVGRGNVETILSRGDYRVGELIFKAFQAGEIFSAWDSHFHYAKWEPFIKSLELEGFRSEIEPEQTLPWDHIEINFRKEHLLQEYQKSKSILATPSCTNAQCSICGGCFYPLSKTRADHSKPEMEKLKKIQSTPVRSYKRTRIFYKKTGDFRFFSHLSLMKYVEHLIRKAEISFQCTEGFHPRMKASFLAALPVFAQGLDEVMELFIEISLREEQILAALKEVSANFIFNRVISCQERKPLMKDIQFIEFEIKMNIKTTDLENIRSFLFERDIISYADNRLNLTIDFTRQGQERFSKIYKIIDPKRIGTCHLTRKQIIFKE